MFTVI